MDFDFSDEQYSFRDAVRGLLADRFAGPRPGAPLVASDSTDALWAGLTELGVFSLLLPEEFGGLGLSLVDLALIVEEFGRQLVPPSIVDTLIATDALVRFGTTAQKSMLLPAIAQGRSRIAIAMSEADTGYDLRDMATMLTRGGQPVLTGRKILVASAARADRLLVAARSEAAAGIGLVLVEPSRPGVSVRRHETLDSSCRYSEVSFDRVALPATDGLCGGDAAARRTLDTCAWGAAMLMTGIAGKVFDTTIEYVKHRNQFGKPLGSFQAIKHRCADMMVSLDSSRSAAYYAAWALANESNDQSKAVSIAKSYCGDSARFICDQGTQLHGGMGFTWELGLHFNLRRATLLEYAYGSAIFHRQRVLEETLKESLVG